MTTNNDIHDLTTHRNSWWFCLLFDDSRKNIVRGYIPARIERTTASLLRDLPNRPKVIVVRNRINQVILFTIMQMKLVLITRRGSQQAGHVNVPWWMDDGVAHSDIVFGWLWHYTVGLVAHWGRRQKTPRGLEVYNCVGRKPDAQCAWFRSCFFCDAAELNKSVIWMTSILLGQSGS